MTVRQSTSQARSRKARKQKPEKPRPDFPLFPHGNGQWCKKIRGKQHFFGVWDNPDTALEAYLDQKDDLHAGRKPRARRDGLTLKDLCNRFLTAKQRKVDSGELSPRTFQDYYRTCESLLKFWDGGRLVEDLTAIDFDELRADTAKRRRAVGVGNMVRLTRIVFKYGYDAGMIDRPVRFGPEFKEPSKKIKRKQKRENGQRLYAASQIRKILNNAGDQLRAMTLLGINAGLGNTDCSDLTPKEIDLKSGWLDYPRPKTGIERRAKLWPETIEALRPLVEGKAEGERVFQTVRGNAWVRVNATGANVDNVATEFSKLLKDTKVHRKGLGFYALRHTFETVGGETKDQPAVDHIMGHVDPSMAATYREEISDDRLKSVTDHVREWLFREHS